MADQSDAAQHPPQSLNRMIFVPHSVGDATIATIMRIGDPRVHIGTLHWLTPPNNRIICGEIFMRAMIYIGAFGEARFLNWQNAMYSLLQLFSQILDSMIGRK